LTPQVSYDEVSIQETRLVKPDVAILHVDQHLQSGQGVVIAPAPLIGRVALEAPVKSQSIEIHETETGLLVTAIEILSPVNKRPGHEAFNTYQRKRRDLLRADVHLLEIDLLRGGRRPPLTTPLPDAPYFVFLSRSERRPAVEIWPLSLQAPIPVLPIPLLPPDADAPLDLNRATQIVYDEAAYDLQIDYHQLPPKPSLTPEEIKWLETHLKSVGVR
jgi:hypothetical protein